MNQLIFRLFDVDYLMLLTPTGETILTSWNNLRLGNRGTWNRDSSFPIDEDAAWTMGMQLAKK